MKYYLEFKERKTEESYKKYNLNKRRLVLKMQRIAIGFFSFLGIFHLIYLQPRYLEVSTFTICCLIVAAIGLLISMFMSMCMAMRRKDLLIFITNMIINLTLIEPNFLAIVENVELCKTHYFWIGFRISSINLITLMCYNSFIYKIMQTSMTLVFLIIRLNKDATLHNVLVDSGIGVVTCIFFFNQERGERMTYLELYKISLQRKSWKDFLNFLPDGIAVFNKDFNCVFMNESVKSLFSNFSDSDDIKRTLLNLKKMNSDFSEIKNNKFSGGFPRLKDHFQWFYAKFPAGRPETPQSGFSKRNKSNKKSDNSKNTYNSDLQENFNEQFFSEYEGQYLRLKLTHINFDNKVSTLVLISDLTISIKSHVLALEENKRFRDTLFASFSHEIRTPLNCILLLLGKLMKGSHSIPQKILDKYISPSYYSSQILLHLVNNILDYSFLIRNELSLKISQLDIKYECLEILELISTQALLKGITLTLKLDRNIPLTIKTDAARLKQILCHLLLNAIKFTFEGHITLRVMRSLDFRNGIVFVVKDTGIGMSENEQISLKEKLRLNSFSSFKVTENAAGASLKTLLSQSLALKLGFQEGKGISFLSKYMGGSQFGFVIQNHIEIEANSKEVAIGKDLNKDKIEEKLSSGILIKWVTKRSPLKFRDFPNFLCFKTKANSALFDIKKEISEVDLFSVSIQEDLKQSKIDQEELESNVSERKESRTTIPDFEDMMLLKTNSKIAKNEYLFKQINVLQPDLKSSCQSNSKPKVNCDHPQILVVDDDEFNILAVKTILKKNSFLISFARNGAQAIELLHNETVGRKDCCKKFKLILMDVNMPVMGGLEATRILKEEMKDNKLPWMPIVGCTAFVSTNDEIICREKGMDDYETKPLNERKLRRLLQQWAADASDT